MLQITAYGFFSLLHYIQPHKTVHREKILLLDIQIYLIIYQKMECDFYRKKMSFLIEGLSMFLEHVCIIRYEEVVFFKEIHVLNAVPLMQRIL